MTWIKDGKVFNGKLVIDGKVSFVAGDPKPELMRNLGWEEYTPSAVESPAVEVDRTAFDAACAQFRAVCKRIRKLAGLPNFKGGFDEMADFQSSELYMTLSGLRMAIAWSAANELCIYEGAKIDLGQPEWWYQCWEMDEPEVVEEPRIEPPEVPEEIEEPIEPADTEEPDAPNND